MVSSSSHGHCSDLARNHFNLLYVQASRGVPGSLVTLEITTFLSVSFCVLHIRQSRVYDERGLLVADYDMKDRSPAYDASWRSLLAVGTSVDGGLPFQGCIASCT